MDMVEATVGIRRFVVLGICSGAANGYWLAQKDPRVVGLLMFDGFAFPNFKTQLYHDWTRFHTGSILTVVKKLATRALRLIGVATSPKTASIFNSVSDKNTPSRGEFARVVDSLVARGVSLYVIYTGSLLLYHNYAGQWNDVFRGANFLEHVRYEFMPDVDHIATPIAAQGKLFLAVCDWVRDLA